MRYESGWFTGAFEYYDSKLREHKVNYQLDDGYQTFSPDDFESVEVIVE